MVMRRLCLCLFHVCGHLQWRGLSVHVPVSVLEGRDRTGYFRAVWIAVEPQRFCHRCWGWGGGG